MNSTSAPRIVFFGTPDFAVSSLSALVDHGYDIVTVVTSPDKPVGRSQTLSYSAVKTYATEHQLPVLQPHSLKREKKSGKIFYDTFQELAPDMAIVVAYGKIIPEYYLSLPRYGFLNVHGSVLPALRGPSPIHEAILQGYTETGITIMILDSGMDTGPILTTAKIPITPRETTVTLHDKLKNSGAKLLVETIPGYINGTIQPQAQDSKSATLTHIITKEHGLVDLKKDSAVTIDRMVRAYTPWPGVYTHTAQGTRIKLIAVREDHGRLHIDQVQPEGKKRMPYAEYLKGNPPLV